MGMLQSHGDLFQHGQGRGRWTLPVLTEDGCERPCWLSGGDQVGEILPLSVRLQGQEMGVTYLRKPRGFSQKACVELLTRLSGQAFWQHQQGEHHRPIRPWCAW